MMENISFPVACFDWNDAELISMFMDKEEREKVMKERGQKIRKYVDSSDEGNNVSSNDKEGESEIEWAIADCCRAVYSADDQYYEATILAISNANTYKVRFVGYGNEETVSRDKIRESHGKAAQDAQEADAACTWNPGDYCRALYEEDGKWYEAKVIRFIDDDVCAVKFIGFNEVENVHALRPSRGKIARGLQKDLAIARGKQRCYSFDECSSYSSRYSSISDHNSVTAHKKRQFAKRSKSHHHNQVKLESISSSEGSRYHRHSNSRPLDTICIRSRRAPPAAIHNCGISNDHRSLSTLLMSWYMAGYHEGIHQGHRSRSKRSCCCGCSH